MSSIVGNTHEQNLDVLCRTCGNIKMGYTYILNDFMDELEKVFIENNLKNDVIGVHPPRFCLKCYSLIKTNMKRGNYVSHDSVLWSPHSNDCDTCNRREKSPKVVDVKK